MTEEDLKEAVKHAKEFLKRAAKVSYVPGKWGVATQPKERGAVKRASMDLTRALADLRHPCRVKG